MWYYPTAPLSSASPNYLVGLSSQRSNPTCSLSLANVSASGKSSSSNSEEQDHDMEIDTLVTVPPTDKRCNIPFPKRPHSLLRSTPSGSRPHATFAGGDRSRSPVAQECEVEEEENVANDQDPPRKRTRTSAISTSTRTRSRRIASLPSPPPPSRAQSSVTIEDQATPVQLSRPLPSIPSPSPIPVEFPVSSSYANSSFSSSSTSYSHSASPSLPSQVPSLVAGSVSSPSGKTRSSAWSLPRRRRASPEETASNLRLYQMLLSGLAARYGVHQDRSGMSSATAYLEAVLRDTRSYLDVQDALLAQRLRTTLVINGIDMRQVSIVIDTNIQNERTSHPGEGDRDSPFSCDTPMELDDIPEIGYPDTDSPFLSKETQTPKSMSTRTSPQFIVTYQRHVANSLFRHQNQGRASSRLRAKSNLKSASAARQVSSLAVEP